MKVKVICWRLGKGYRYGQCRVRFRLKLLLG